MRLLPRSLSGTLYNCNIGRAQPVHDIAGLPPLFLTLECGQSVSGVLRGTDQARPLPTFRQIHPPAATNSASLARIQYCCDRRVVRTSW